MVKRKTSYKRFSKEDLERRRQQMLINRAKRPENMLDDPKKQDFLRRYYEPSSPTYANAYQSALDAGFAESYAKTITSPSLGLKWVKIENYKDATNMTPQHIIKSAERIALRGSKDSEQLKALEFLAKINGMLVEKKVVASVSIEDLLNDDGKAKTADNVIEGDVLDLDE